MTRGQKWLLLVLSLCFLVVSPFVYANYAPFPEIEVRPVHMYVIKQGDTLWDIACRDYPEHDPREIIDWILERNDVDPGRLIPGKWLVVP